VKISLRPLLQADPPKLLMRISRIIQSLGHVSNVRIARFSTGPKFNLEEWEALSNESNPPEREPDYQRGQSDAARPLVEATVKAFVDSAARRQMERNDETDPETLEAYSVESNPPEVCCSCFPDELTCSSLNRTKDTFQVLPTDF
jgi:hypothetical protein